MENFNPNFLELFSMSNQSFIDQNEIRAPSPHDQTPYDHPNLIAHQFYDPLTHHHFNFQPIHHINPSHEYNYNSVTAPLSEQPQNFLNSIAPLAFETGSSNNKANNYVHAIFNVLAP